MNTSVSDSNKKIKASAPISFPTSKAVKLARENTEFIACPVCGGFEEKYLFHDDSGRHVRCNNCFFVFINPLPMQAPSSATLSAELMQRPEKKRDLMVTEVAELLQRSIEAFQRAQGKKPNRVLLLGAVTPEIIAASKTGIIPAEVLVPSDEQISAFLWQGDSSWLQNSVADTDLIVLHELLDHSLRPEQILKSILNIMPNGSWLAIVFRNNDAFLAKLLRRWWRQYASGRTAFFTAKNINMLARRAGAWPRTTFEVWTRQTLRTAVSRFLSKNSELSLLKPFDLLRFKVPLGRSVTLMETQHQGAEILSIVVPVFNEARYAKQVLTTLCALKLSIDYEIIIVESNSTDGTREIVQKFADYPGVKLILEDRPQGKGHAVRTGLQAATGSIILIQDADFEYDMEDYESLLRPILMHYTEFVLGSRMLGLEGWKVRRYNKTPIKGWLMNFAQKVFAITYNILFRQKTTDINTMFKVFRRSCLSRFELKSNGFELDIELACKLAAAGFAPYEVPVNYCGRGFEDGKKIRFFHDAFHSYLMLYKCWLSSKH